MLSFLFKTSTYYILWKKFKPELLYIIISFITMFFIFLIYNDIYKILKEYDKDSLWILLIIKYSFIAIIIIFNLYHFKDFKFIFPKEIKEKEDTLDPIERKFLEKEVLKTKTDIILEKYSKQKNDN